MKKPFAVLSSLLFVAPVLFTTPAFAAVDPLTTPYNDGANPVTLYLNGTYQVGSVVDDSAIDWTKTANNNKGADPLSWIDANGKPFWQITYTKGNVDVKKPDGTVDQANLNQYDDSLTNSNNGYWITSDNYAGANYLDAWIQELNGDPEYINNIKAQNEGTMTFGPDQWPVWNFASLANSSGAVVGDGSGKGNGVQYKVNTDGVTATPYLQITDTPAPTSSVTTDKQTYNAGDTVNITAIANVFAANTAYHPEVVYVTGPNGFKKFLNITSGSNGTVQAGSESDTQFPYYGVTDQTVKPVWGGGSGNPSTPTTYNDTAAFDTTNLAQGTYTVHYFLYDNVGRASTSGTNGEVTAQFTVGPAKESIKLSPASETVQSGTPVTVAYAVNGMQSGDSVKIVPSGNGVGMWRVSGDKKATDSTTETEATTASPIDVSYTAVVIDKNGNQVASDNTTITWSPGQATQPQDPGNDNWAGELDRPIQSQGDIAVNITEWLPKRVPKMGDPESFNLAFLNSNLIKNQDGDLIGGDIKYTLTATSDDKYWQDFTKTGIVFLPAPDKNNGTVKYSEVKIPINFTSPQSPDLRKNFLIHFKVTIQPYQPEGKNPPPMLGDSDPNNDSAMFNYLIPSVPVVTR